MTSYKKIVACGNILEVYEYEKPPNNKLLNRKEDDDYNALVLEDTELKLFGDSQEERIEERRKQTVRDARNMTRRLALMNFGPGDTFITLTYAKNMQDLIQADDDFKKFIKRMKYRLGLEKLDYIAVREFQKRGAIHFHMLCNWQRPFETESEIRHYECFLGEEVWKHGFVDIKKIDHVDNLGAYLVKYMTKNLSIELFKGKKMYLPSKGLKRPLVYRGDEAERIFKCYELRQKKEVFTNSYESEYNGQIIYKEYNLKRQ